MTRLVLCGAIALGTLAGCALAPSGPDPRLDLSGIARFAAPRATQATLSEVASYATVSLIDAANNRSVSTTLTNENGAFRLSFPSTFKPDPAKFYYLEAVKGLSENRPGYVAARLRTLARFNNGWTTLTNTQPNGGIVVDLGTTALSIGAALRHNNPASFDFLSLIGAYSPEEGGHYVHPAPALSTDDYGSLVALTAESLGRSEDPVASVGLTLPNTWHRRGAYVTVSAIEPASGSVGTSLTIRGTGFSAIPGNNLVTLGDARATVATSSLTFVTVTVPPEARTASVSIRVGAFSALGPTFTVTGVVSGGVSDQF
ncbi:IPT/TIG domain-containing protein [bacterium]|nr:IPT/TIG domain-containing protein [bacterium]